MAGRPSKLDQVVHTRKDGTTVTAAEQVLERVRLGLDWGEAADSSAISRTTLHSWRLRGARARALHAQGQPVPPAERRYMAFLDDLERAQAEAELQRLGVIERATLPFTTTKVVERTVVNPDGTEQVVERTVTTETKPGQWTAAAWWLERRHQARYALRRVELSGPDGGPIPMAERAADLAASLRAFQAVGNTDN